MSVPSWKPCFSMDWRLLVKESIANIGIPLKIFWVLGVFLNQPTVHSGGGVLAMPKLNYNFCSSSPLFGGCTYGPRLRFKHAQPKLCYSPKVEDGVEN